MADLSTLINIGKIMKQKLRSIEIYSAEDLLQIGSKEAYYRLKQVHKDLCLVHLYMLHGAVIGTDYNHLSQEIREDLKTFNSNLGLKYPPV